MTDGKDKTMFDWIQLHGKSLPGPGDYDTDAAWRSMLAPSGGKFNDSRTLTNPQYKRHIASLAIYISCPSFLSCCLLLARLDLYQISHTISF